MTVDRNKEQLEAILKVIKANYKQDSIGFALEQPDPERIPTGILEIDSLTGGGFPIGRISQIYGEYSSGKTLISLYTIANAQRQGKVCAFYDLENQFSADWAASVGVDVNKLVLVDGSVIEDMTEKMEALFSVVDLHVVDSIGMGISLDELSSDSGQWLPGIHSRVWGKCMKRLNKAMDDKENAIILLNQAYTIFGKNAGAETPRGGKFIQHVSSLTLNTKRSSWLFKDKNGILTKDGDKTNSFTGDIVPQGIEIQIRLDKNRVYVPGNLDSARIRLELNSGGKFDTVWTLSRAAIHYKIVKQAGAWFELPNGEKVQGQNGLRKALENDPELMELCRKALIT